MVQQLMCRSNLHGVHTDLANGLPLNIRLPSQVLVDPRDLNFAQTFSNRSEGSYASKQESRIDACGSKPALDNLGGFA
jgi:hypothetical protein